MTAGATLNSSFVDADRAGEVSRPDPVNDFERRLLAAPSLPTVPPVAQRLLELLRRDAELSEIADAIKVDASLTAKLLRVINSPFYGIPREISSVRDALLYLGTNSVRSIALSFSFVRSLRGGRARPEVDHLWRTSLMTALAARRLAEDVGEWPPEDAFLTGLISDTGALLLYDLVPEHREIVACFLRGGGDLIALERAELQSDHARLGALLLRQWNFPESLCDLVGRHHVTDEYDDGSSGGAAERILNAAWICARTLCLEGFRAEVPELRRWLHEYVQIPVTRVEAILEDLPREFHEVATHFDIPSEQQRSYQDLLTEANETLRDLALRSEQRFRELSASPDPAHAGFSELRASLNLLPEPSTGMLRASDLETLLQTLLPRAMQRRCPVGVMVLEMVQCSFDGESPKDDEEQLTRALGQRVREFVRSDDEVAELGRHQLGIVLIDCDAGDLPRVAERLQGWIESAGLEVGEAQAEVEIAIGAAHALPGERRATGPALLERAHGALVEARRRHSRIGLARS